MPAEIAALWWFMTAQPAKPSPWPEHLLSPAGSLPGASSLFAGFLLCIVHVLLVFALCACSARSAVDRAPREGGVVPLLSS